MKGQGFMTKGEIHIRNAQKHEFVQLGQLMVEVYSQLKGFPTREQQPAYYELLAHIGDFTEKPGAELLVALSAHGDLLGGVVYFSNMAYYGSGGTAPQEKQAAGFRLLAVNPRARGMGVGRALSQACIDKAKAHNHPQIIIHTTETMKIAWAMYEKLGFKRSPDLDFMQGKLRVYGFRLELKN